MLIESTTPAASAVLRLACSRFQAAQQGLQ
jgi:hypothetical protein